MFTEKNAAQQTVNQLKATLKKIIIINIIREKGKQNSESKRKLHKIK